VSHPLPRLALSLLQNGRELRVSSAYGAVDVEMLADDEIIGALALSSDAAESLVFALRSAITESRRNGPGPKPGEEGS